MGEYNELSDYENISFVRRVNLTPSGLLYQNKQPEMSNRVLRKYSNIID